MDDLIKGGGGGMAWGPVFGEIGRRYKLQYTRRKSKLNYCITSVNQHWPLLSSNTPEWHTYKSEGSLHSTSPVFSCTQNLVSVPMYERTVLDGRRAFITIFVWGSFVPLCCQQSATYSIGTTPQGLWLSYLYYYFSVTEWLTGWARKGRGGGGDCNRYGRTSNLSNGKHERTLFFASRYDPRAKCKTMPNATKIWIRLLEFIVGTIEWHIP